MSRTLARQTRIFEKILFPFNNICLKVSMVALVLMPLPIIVDVLLRIFANTSVLGVIEMVEFAMIFLVFLALGSVQQEEGQVRIDIIVSLVSEKTMAAISLFTNLLGTIFVAMLFGCAVVQGLKKMSEISFSLKLPLGFFLLVAAIGLLLFFLVMLGQCLHSLAKNFEFSSYSSIIIVIVLVALLASSPFWMKYWGLKPPNLVLGGMGMVVMLLLLFLRMPIGLAMGVVGFLGLLTLYPVTLPVFTLVGVSPYSTTASFVMAVIPLFILMGELCLRAGISNDLIIAASTWLGRLPAGLGVASVVGCAGFSAVCGDSMATAVTMGSVALPEMRRKKYSLSLACGCLAAGGTLGILIPPSIGFIFYAIITEESVGKLFAAGVIPGLVLAGLFIVTLQIVAWRYPGSAPRGEKTSLREKISVLKNVVYMLILFALILGGIFSGWFSPTEGGAVGAFGAFIIALIRCRLTWKNFVSSVRDTALFSSKLMLIMIGVGILSYFLAATRLPAELANLIIGFQLSPYVFLAAIIVLFIVLGCVMNVIPMLLLTLPALYPTVLVMGFDPIWFGVLIVVVMEMGQITPPVGVNVFAMSSVAPDVPVEQIFRGVLPFVLAMLVMVVLLIVFPGMATWLPNVLFSL